MNRRLLVTRYQGKIITALWEEDDIIELNCESEENTSLLGNIYVGRVQNIVKNINAAFIAFQDGENGYFSLESNKNPLFTNPKHTDKVCVGDWMLVQVEKENIKTKAPVLTSRLTLTGKYAVLTAGNTSFSFSGKITDKEWRRSCLEACRDFNNEEYGFIIRTNAQEISFEEIRKELKKLSVSYKQIIRDSAHRTCGSCLYKTPAMYLNSLKNVYSYGLEGILTDEADLYEEMKRFLESEQPEDTDKLQFYQDELLPLKNLYNLNHVIQHALLERVWLKSGAYLVIQPTEALTVIDVNTGKCMNQKEKSEAVCKINLEAAKEIGKQLRLRNLSGIIIVDFINMSHPEYKKQLLQEFEIILRRDPVKTVLSGITGLGLVELTRKKVKKPFHEQMTSLCPVCQGSGRLVQKEE